jgi:hypothetical protein
MSSVKQRWQFHNSKFTGGSNRHYKVADHDMAPTPKTKPLQQTRQITPNPI